MRASRFGLGTSHQARRPRRSRRPRLRARAATTVARARATISSTSRSRIACGDRVAGSSPEDDRCELDDPALAGSRPRWIWRASSQRRVQSEVSRHELLELRGGPAAVLASRCGGEPGLAHVVPAAPVAGGRPERREAHVPPVRRHADAVDAGAARDRNPPAALGPGAKNGERVVADARRGRPAARVERSVERAPPPPGSRRLRASPARSPHGDRRGLPRRRAAAARRGTRRARGGAAS